MFDNPMFNHVYCSHWMELTQENHLLRLNMSNSNGPVEIPRSIVP
jgi:hypothetical protein